MRGFPRTKIAVEPKFRYQLYGVRELTFLEGGIRHLLVGIRPTDMAILRWIYSRSMRGFYKNWDAVEPI